jgi:hypothetical protein
LTEVNGGRAICVSAGGKDFQFFNLELEAMQWVNQPLGTPVIIRRTDVVRAGRSTGVVGAGGAGLSGVAPAAGTERSARGSVVVSAMGDDPSVGDPTRVYNTLVDSQGEMNRALWPDGMTNEDRSGLYNNMIDIAALPGRSKKSEGAASTDIALLAQLLSSEQGVAKHRTNIAWRNASKDTLSKIKSRKTSNRSLRS